MRQLFPAGLILIAGTITATADPKFHPYESRQPLIKEGQGGERNTVEGIDIWIHGDPPKRYMVLGVVDDERKKKSIWGHEARDLDGDISKAVKAAGGDAAILDGEKTSISGYIGLGDDDFITREKLNSRYVVVKYLPDSPAAAPQR